MKIEDQVCSLEFAKRLPELGVKQDSLFCWTTQLDLEFLPTEIRNQSVVIAAFTVAELGEMLPDRINNEDDCCCLFYYDKYNNCHRISYVEDCGEIVSPYVETKGDTEANARAKMLIYLIENNLVTDEWKKQWLKAV